MESGSRRLPGCDGKRRDLHSEGGYGIVWSVEVSLECDAGASANAVEERISALAGGDVFRQARGKPADARCVRVYVGTEVGTAEFSFLDRRPGARGAATALIASRSKFVDAIARRRGRNAFFKKN